MSRASKLNGLIQNWPEDKLRIKPVKINTLILVYTGFVFWHGLKKTRVWGSVLHANQDKGWRYDCKKYVRYSGIKILDLGY